MSISSSKTEAVKWARRQLKQLLKSGKYSRRAAFNTVFIDARRKFNIGCSSAIEKALKMQYNPESEEEITKWENGETS